MHDWAHGALFSARKLVLAGIFVTASLCVVRAETVTIAALGDSLTQGFGLSPDLGFVPQLETWLEGQGADVALINAGVSGDTTRGGLSRVAWTLTPEVDAMIVALGGNDLLRGIDPASSRANLRGILQVAQDQNIPVLLVGLPAPANFGPDFKRDFEMMYPELAAEFGALHVENFLGPISEGDQSANAMRYMQSDGIHPNAEGVAVIVAAMGPTVLDLVDQAE